jgi:hypothetical protein
LDGTDLVDKIPQVFTLLVLDLLAEEPQSAPQQGRRARLRRRVEVVYESEHGVADQDLVGVGLGMDNACVQQVRLQRPIGDVVEAFQRQVLVGKNESELEDKEPCQRLALRLFRHILKDLPRRVNVPALQGAPKKFSSLSAQCFTAGMPNLPPQLCLIDLSSVLEQRMASDLTPTFCKGQGVLGRGDDPFDLLPDELPPNQSLLIVIV